MDKGGIEKVKIDSEKLRIAILCEMGYFIVQYPDRTANSDPYLQGLRFAFGEIQRLEQISSLQPTKEGKE